jgi:tetratricopeptide (TPR) repeat protein
MRNLWSKQNLLIDGLVLVGIVIFLLTYLDPKLLFLKTTINGGDTGSHYHSAVYLKEVLLPQGKIMGWMPWNYAGFPLFYHYFPFPFLLMAGLSCFIPMEIAFKLITVLGIFLLPFAVYFAFRALDYEFPVPILGAILTLPFLFNQGNSMWGGNIPSTLAGEFAYSLGFALVFLFFGTLYKGVTGKKWLVLNAFLVFLISFSHAYTMIFCLILGAYFALVDLKKNFLYLFGVYSLGSLFLAFWMLPLLGNIGFTTPFVFRWTINSLLEVFPLSLIPLMLLSLFAVILNRKDSRTAYFVYAILACVFVYMLGPRVGILDIRFVPFFQLLLAVFGATLVLPYKDEIESIYLLPLIALLMVGIWVNANTTFVRGWISWNYSGYERKVSWPVFNGINEYLRHSGDGRVEWEHAPADEALGSIRTYETIPYFAGRQTLEGIHMLGSATAPAVFYIESETSYQPCNPIPDYFYSTFNLRTGIEHFKLFNVSHFVVRSPQVKEAIKKYPELKLEKTVGEYNIYRLTTNPGEYVSALKNQPVLFLTNNWKSVSYQWFAREELEGVFPVFKKDADQMDRSRFSLTAASLSGIKKVPYPPKEIRVKSVIKDETIDIETSEIGHPLLIRVSYHPNWKVDGADRIYLAAPSFMIIFPNRHNIHLHFEPGPLNRAGTALSILGILIAASLLLYRGKGKEGGAEAKSGIITWLVVISLAVSVAAGFFIISFIKPSPDAMIVRARAEFNRGSYDAAQRDFWRVMERSNLSSGFHNEAEIFYATTFIRKNRFQEGAERMREFIRDYPDSFWTPQAYFDLAYCENNLGHRQAAADIYHKIIRDFPTTSWAAYSKERLKEFEAKNKP